MFAGLAITLIGFVVVIIGDRDMIFLTYNDYFYVAMHIFGAVLFVLGFIIAVWSALSVLIGIRKRSEN